MFLSVLITLQFLVISTKSVLVEYKVNNNTQQANITGKVLNNITIHNSVTSISILNYFDQPQINSVANLTELTEIAMYNQKIFPKLNYLPKLLAILFTKNDLIFVARDYISLTPVMFVGLAHNNILRIEDGSFGSNVTNLNLQCNFLNKFDPEWFQKHSKLYYLDLSGNKITQIQKNAFEDFKFLHVLYLSHNGLKVISDGAFSNTKTFYAIDLSYNKLTELKATIFQRANISIVRLQVQFNNLTFLSQELMNKLHLTTLLGIDGNPWQCPCYEKIRKWILWDLYGIVHRIDREGEPRCIMARSFKDNCIEHFDQELLETFASNLSAITQKTEFCSCSLINPNMCEF